MSLQYAKVTPNTHFVRETPDVEFLNEVVELFQAGYVEAGMNKLGGQLHYLYTSTSTSEWAGLVDNVLLKHPLRKLLMQDPLTARSFAQPRGYAGDAVLLDMIYFPYKTNLENTTELGRKLYKYTTRTSICQTLCQRMRMIAKLIDETSSLTANARVLSVASGHCREASYSDALKNHGLGRFVALDHDIKSLEVMKLDYENLGLVPEALSVKEIIKGENNIGKFDLIYSAGLYDYLGKRFAQKLTESLFHMLAPQGKLVLINIASDYEEIGYLESYMNWTMIGRSNLDTLELAAGLQTNAEATLNLKEVGNINSHYQILEIEKH